MENIISTSNELFGIGVADKPEGHYLDALGKPLLANKDGFDSKHSWACINPFVFVDQGGQSYV